MVLDLGEMGFTKCWANLKFQDSILLWQRKCEDALYAMLVLGARRPVRHLASMAMANIILKGDSISIYSRASSLQGFLSDGKKSEPHRVAGLSVFLRFAFSFLRLYVLLIFFFFSNIRKENLRTKPPLNLHLCTFVSYLMPPVFDQFFPKSSAHELQNLMVGRVSFYMCFILHLNCW